MRRTRQSTTTTTTTTTKASTGVVTKGSMRSSALLHHAGIVVGKEAVRTRVEAFDGDEGRSLSAATAVPYHEPVEGVDNDDKEEVAAGEVDVRGGLRPELVRLKLETAKPIGLGIIGPGAEPEHIAPRLEAHARAAIQAVARMLE